MFLSPTLGEKCDLLFNLFHIHLYIIGIFDDHDHKNEKSYYRPYLDLTFQHFKASKIKTKLILSNKLIIKIDVS